MSNESNKPVGIIALSNIDIHNSKAELSLAFKNGLGTRIVAETIFFVFDYAFHKLELNKLYFYITADNAKALKMARTYKMKKEGLLYEEMLSENGELLDLYRFCMLRRNWTKSPLFNKLSRIS